MPSTSINSIIPISGLRFAIVVSWIDQAALDSAHEGRFNKDPTSSEDEQVAPQLSACSPASPEKDAYCRPAPGELIPPMVQLLEARRLRIQPASIVSMKHIRSKHTLQPKAPSTGRSRCSISCPEKASELNFDAAVSCCLAANGHSSFPQA